MLANSYKKITPGTRLDCIRHLLHLPSTLVMCPLELAGINVCVPVLRGLMELGFYGRMPFLSPTK